MPQEKWRTDALMNVLAWFSPLAVVESITAFPATGKGVVKLISAGRHITITVEVGEVIE